MVELDWVGNVFSSSSTSSIVVLNLSFLPESRLAAQAYAACLFLGMVSCQNVGFLEKNADKSA